MLSRCRSRWENLDRDQYPFQPIKFAYLLVPRAYHLEPSSPNWAGATAFSHLELFLELLLARKHDIISHASYLPSSWTNKSLLAELFSCTVYLFKMADELDSTSSEFSDTSSSFLDSSLESSVSESEAEDSGGETADAECKSSDSQRRKTPKAKTNG